MSGLRIESVPPYREIQRTVIEEAKKTEKEAGQRPSFDRNAVGNAFLETVQPQAPSDVAGALRKQYPQIQFVFADVAGLEHQSESIAQLAGGLKKGAYIFVSSDILEWMSKGPEAFEEGSRLIGQTAFQLMRDLKAGAYNVGAVIGDEGETVCWKAEETEESSVKQEWEQELENVKNMLDRLEESRKKNAERLKKLKLTQKKKINYQMGRDMARLAKGVTDKDVRSLISRVYAARGRVAGSKSYDKKEIQSAVAQMDHVIRCARTKIRHLKEEGQLELRRKKAEKQKEEKMRRELERELKERRRARRAKEHARIFQKLPDLPGLRDNDDRREAREEALAAAAAAGLSPTGAVGTGEALGGGVPAGGGEAAAPELQVTVSMM